MTTLENNLLSTNECCSLFMIQKQTLYTWYYKGFVEKYKDPISGRVFYKIPKNIKDSKLMSIKDVCSELKISRRHLSDLKYKGLLVPVISNTRYPRYSKQQIEEYKEECQKRLVRV